MTRHQNGVLACRIEKVAAHGCIRVRVFSSEPAVRVGSPVKPTGETGVRKMFRNVGTLTTDTQCFVNGPSTSARGAGLDATVSGVLQYRQE
jgi:hypothetical protein